MGEAANWPLVVATAVTSIMAYLSTRDKLKYDNERQQLRTQIQSLTDKTSECENERNADRAKYEEAIHEIKDELKECRKSHEKIKEEVFARVDEIIKSSGENK